MGRDASGTVWRALQTGRWPAREREAVKVGGVGWLGLGVVTTGRDVGRVLVLQDSRLGVQLLDLHVRAGEGLGGETWPTHKADVGQTWIGPKAGLGWTVGRPVASAGGQRWMREEGLGSPLPAKRGLLGHGLKARHRLAYRRTSHRPVHPRPLCSGDVLQGQPERLACGFCTPATADTNLSGESFVRPVPVPPRWCPRVAGPAGAAGRGGGGG